MNGKGLEVGGCTSQDTCLISIVLCSSEVKGMVRLDASFLMMIAGRLAGFFYARFRYDR